MLFLNGTLLRYLKFLKFTYSEKLQKFDKIPTFCLKLLSYLIRSSWSRCSIPSSHARKQRFKPWRRQYFILLLDPARGLLSFSKSETVLWTIAKMLLHYYNVKNKMEISSTSEAFSEYMNFRLIANSRNIVPDSQDSFPTQNFTVDTFGQANSIDKLNFPVPHCQNCRQCYIIHAMNTC